MEVAVLLNFASSILVFLPLALATYPPDFEFHLENLNVVFSSTVSHVPSYEKTYLVQRKSI
jgi:hypothetical protein